MLIKCDRIYTSCGVQSGYLKVVNGCFAGIEKEADEDYLDYTPYRIIPGIIDTHNHGTMGYATESLPGYTEEDLEYNFRNYLSALPLHGVTGVLPAAETTVFKTIRKVVNEGYKGAKVLGIHSEGPYLYRVGEKGTQKDFPVVKIEEIKQAIDDADGLLVMMDVAPEIPGIDEVISLLLENGIKVGYAHSSCTYEEALNAIEKGISVGVHLANVMTGLHHRDIGGCGALLTSDKVDCEIICDGLHVSLPYLSLLFKVKDYSRFMMVSDSSYLAGIAPGIYPSRDEGTMRHVDEEGFIKDSDGRLNGSSKAVLYGIGNLVEKLHIPLEIVIQMASLNPARVYGWESQKGSIEKGKDADFVIIDDQYRALATYVEGECVFDLNHSVIEFNPNLKLDHF